VCWSPDTANGCLVTSLLTHEKDKKRLKGWQKQKNNRFGEDAIFRLVAVDLPSIWGFSGPQPPGSLLNRYSSP